MSKQKRFSRNVIAMVYDFDGTLSPQPMQDYTILPEIGIRSGHKFWDEVNRQSRETVSETMLVYMRLILEKAAKEEVPISRENLRKLASRIKYFPGVESWFDRTNKWVERESANGVQVRHYVISAGLKEILDGASIRGEFHRIYASEYHFDYNGVAKFPKLLITDTTKTQFLFRINKGKEDIRESINEHMPESQRPIPFSNIIYIGDGQSDVPSMALTKKNGGHTIAVYNKKSQEGFGKCRELLDARRADFIAPADYRENSDLTRRVRVLLKSVISQIEYQKELYECRRKIDSKNKT